MGCGPFLGCDSVVGEGGGDERWWDLGEGAWHFGGLELVGGEVSSFSLFGNVGVCGKVLVRSIVENSGC